MANRRINEITKELVADGHKITNKDVIAFLDAQGIEGKMHSSMVDEGIEKKIKDHFAGNSCCFSDRHH